MHFHKWSNWIIIRVSRIPPFDEFDAQERFCLKCNMIERKRL